jgi:O-Antigen ligase
VIRMPWVGLSYMVGDVQVVGSREWTIEGVSRLAGLGRSSIAAGCQILFFAVFLMCFSRSRLLSLVVWACSAPAVLLTTSRSALLGYAAASAFWFLFWLFPSLYRLWKWAVPAMFALVVLVPLIPADSFRIIESATHSKAGQVASFFDRIENTWPEAFDLVATDGSFIFGRGLGGIGTAQKTFEPELENPADNLFVYLFVIFGPFSLLMLASVLVRVQRVNIQRGAAALHMICTALAVAGVGLMLNGIEDSCASIFAGMLVCQLFAKGAGWRRPGAWRLNGGSGRR